MDHNIELYAQPVSTFPDLQNDETITFETGQGIPLMVFIACAAITIFPPFIFGALLLSHTWWCFKDGRIVLTNFRLIIFKKKVFGGFVIDSIPIYRIKKVVNSLALTRPVKNMLVEHKPINVYVEGSLMPKAKCLCVRNAKELIRKFEQQRSIVSNP